MRIPRAALLPVMEAHSSPRQAVWQTFAERRLDDLVRESARYSALGRKGRLAWLRQAYFPTSLRLLAEPLGLDQGHLPPS